jgi:hypothetical protein
MATLRAAIREIIKRKVPFCELYSDRGQPFSTHYHIGWQDYSTRPANTGFSQLPGQLLMGSRISTRKAGAIEVPCPLAPVHDEDSLAIRRIGGERYWLLPG